MFVNRSSSLAILENKTILPSFDERGTVHRICTFFWSIVRFPFTMMDTSLEGKIRNSFRISALEKSLRITYWQYKNIREERITLGKVVEDFWKNELAYTAADATGDLRQAFRLFIGFHAKIVNTVAKPVIVLNIFQGIVGFSIALKNMVAFVKNNDMEGVSDAFFSAVAHFFNGLAGCSWALPEWFIPEATNAAMLFNALVAPLFAVTSFFGLLRAIAHLVREIKFEDEFNKIPKDGTKNKKQFVDFLDRYFTLAKEEKIEIEKRLSSEKNVQQILSRVRKENSGKTDLRTECKIAAAKERDLCINRALQKKKAEFERRTNGECSLMVLENLEKWKHHSSSARITVAEAYQKIKDTIFWNKVRFVCLILIQITFFVALIAFSLCPAGNAVIFAFFLAGGLGFFLLDLRGSIYWPVIRQKIFGDPTQKKLA